MYCMNKIHKDLPAAKFEKPDTIITAEACSSGYAPNDACRNAMTVRSDYYVAGSSLIPDPEAPCPIHVPSPTPTPVPEDEAADEE
jgi:penicillin-binding protein 1A